MSAPEVPAAPPADLAVVVVNYNAGLETQCPSQNCSYASGASSVRRRVLRRSPSPAAARWPSSESRRSEREHAPMADFDELVDEAEHLPIDAWDFSWLNGRAVEERPTWRYFDRVIECTTGVSALLEVQAGMGSMIGSLPSLPGLAVATEGFPPSVTIAAPRLRSAGVNLVVTSQSHPGLPFADRSFDLVISRHPVDVWWNEIHRVLRPGGSYFAQHVGPHSLRSLSEFLMGPLPDMSKRDVGVELRAAERAGLVVHRMELERPRVAFYDIGAVVYFLRLVPWTVPDFSVAKYRDALRKLHGLIEDDGAFETTASRTLVEATRPA